MRRVLIWLPLVLFAGVFALVASGLLSPEDRTIASRMVGKPLPPIDLPPLLPDRPGITHASLASGKPRLLNIFASWCIPCAAEAPQLMALKQAGVEIDAIAVKDTPDAMRNFLDRYGDPYARIGSDPHSSVQMTLGSSGVPETFVIDGKGRIVEQHIGYIRAEDVPALLAAVRGAQ